MKDKLSHPYPVPGTVNIGERRLLQILSLGACMNNMPRNAPQKTLIILDIVFSAIKN